jgi:hypothetical protein
LYRIYRQTTEFQARYFDKQINFRSNIRKEEDKLLKQTLFRIKSIRIKDPIDATFQLLNPTITQIGFKNVKFRTPENQDKILYVKDNLMYRPTESVSRNARKKHSYNLGNRSSLSVHKDTLQSFSSNNNNNNNRVRDSRSSSTYANKFTDNSFINTSLSTSSNENDPDTITLKNLDMNFPKLNDANSIVNGQTEGSIKSYRSRDRHTRIVRQELVPKSAKIFFNNTQPTPKKVNNATSKLSWYSYDDKRKFNHFSEDNILLTNNDYSDNKSEASYKTYRSSIKNNRGNLPPATTPISQLLATDNYQNRLRYSYSILSRKHNSRFDYQESKQQLANYSTSYRQQSSKSNMQLNDIIRNMKPEKRATGSQLVDDMTDSMLNKIDMKVVQEPVKETEATTVKQNTDNIEKTVPSEDYYPNGTYISEESKKSAERYELKIEIPFVKE